MKKRTFKLRYIFIPPACIVVAGVSFLAWMINHYVHTTVPNAYAQWWAGSTVIEYLREYDDQWPESWDDLEPTFDKIADENRCPWTFEEIQSRVVIEWNVDVDQIRRLPNPPTDLISLRDGGDEHWDGQEPNEMVWRYLKESRRFQ